jgi:hypothetical protein
MRPDSTVNKDFRTFVIPIKRDIEDHRGQLRLKYMRHPNGKQDILVSENFFENSPKPKLKLKLKLKLTRLFNQTFIGNRVDLVFICV